MSTQRKHSVNFSFFPLTCLPPSSLPGRCLSGQSWADSESHFFKSLPLGMTLFWEMNSCLFLWLHDKRKRSRNQLDFLPEGKSLWESKCKPEVGWWIESWGDWKCKILKSCTNKLGWPCVLSTPHKELLSYLWNGVWRGTDLGQARLSSNSTIFEDWA